MSDYDSHYIYHPTLAIVGQKAVILNSQQKILLLQRSEKSGAGGQWSLPGGAIEKGEDSRAAMLREILEETGLSPKKLRPFHVKTYLDQEQFIVIIGYVAKADSESINLNWEHTHYQWITVREALSLDLTGDALTFLEEFIQQNERLI